MPKETRTSQGTGVGLQSTKTRQAGGVVASIRGQADTHSGIGGLAESLKGVLDLGIEVGTDLREDADERDAAQAEMDSLRGVEDANLIRKSYAYENTIQKANLERDVTAHNMEVSRDINEAIANGEIKTMTELSEAISARSTDFLQEDDGTLTEEYGSVSNYGEGIKLLDANRTKLMSSGFDAMEVVRDKEMTDVQRSAMALQYSQAQGFNVLPLLAHYNTPVLDEDGNPTGKFNINDVDKAKQDKLAIQLARTGMNIAIDKGDPEAIRRMKVARYPNNAPVFDAVTIAQLQNAEVQATNRHNNLVAKEDKIEARSAYIEGVLMIRKGQSIEDWAQQAMLDGRITGEKANALYAAEEKRRNEVEEGEYNPETSSRFQTSFWLSKNNYDDLADELTRAYNNDELGIGKAANREYNRLWDVLNKSKNEHERDAHQANSDAWTQTQLRLKGNYIVEKAGSIFTRGGAKPNKVQTSALAEALADANTQIMELDEGDLTAKKLKEILDSVEQTHLKDFETMGAIHSTVIPMTAADIKADNSMTEDQKNVALKALQASRNPTP